MSSPLDQLSAVASLHVENNKIESTTIDLKLASYNLPVITTTCNNSSSKSIYTKKDNQSNSLSFGSNDWARQITLEERKFIREKIKAAYLKTMEDSFNNLIESCSAIEEELTFSNAPSRLDYFKSGKFSFMKTLKSFCVMFESICFVSFYLQMNVLIGVQYEKRVNEKIYQLKNGMNRPIITLNEENTSNLINNENQKSIKRAKTNH